MITSDELTAVVGDQDTFSINSKPFYVSEGDFSSLYTFEARHALGPKFLLNLAVHFPMDEEPEKVYADLTMKTFCCNDELKYSYKEKTCMGCQKSFAEDFPDFCHAFSWEDGILKKASAVKEFWNAWACSYQIAPLEAALTAHDTDALLLPLLRKLVPTLSFLKNSKAGLAGLPGRK